MSDEIVEAEFNEIVQLGGIQVDRPEDVIARGASIATALRKVIIDKELYVDIQGKNYVLVEGWNTLGGMLGVLPVEDWVKEIDGGWMARVKLVRVSDGMEIGGATAMCTRDERNWAKRDEYTLLSMAQTRATGKAYRLSFSWIMKLAGYEVEPAEEADPKKATEASKKLGNMIDEATIDIPDSPKAEQTSGSSESDQSSSSSSTPELIEGTERKANQWEPAILDKAVDLGFAGAKKHAVSVMNLSPFKGVAFGELTMELGIAWFCCWASIKTQDPKLSTADRQPIAIKEWQRKERREEFKRMARESLGEAS